MIVPNQQPKLPADFRLAIVGEAPGADEAAIGEPFVGASGRLLIDTVGKLGFSHRQCFIGNVCQHQPPNNEIENFDLMGPEMVEGRKALFNDLQIFKPNCILLLGNTALRTFRSNDDSIGDFRGSIFQADLAPERWKCLGTYHPSTVQRMFNLYAVFRMDLGRAKSEAGSPDLNLPRRQITIRPSLQQVLDYIALCRNRLTAFDIEGYADNIGVTMVSLAYSPTEVLVIPFWVHGQHYWPEYEEVLIWRALSEWLADPSSPKVCQNALYETFVLGWRHKIIVRGLKHDTMYAHWELFPEFPKNLGFQTSIYTREPYYKEERLSTDEDVKLTYNGKDSAVTIEIHEVVQPRLQAVQTSYNHYRFNCDLIEPFTYIHLRGCLLDQKALHDEKLKAEEELKVLQEQINTAVAGSNFHEEFPTARKKYGGFNVKSTDHKNWLLYDFLGFTPYSRYGKTTKEEVLLKYRAKYDNPLLTTLFRAVQKRTRISDIEKLTVNDDGRVRCSYNPVATNTGRLNCGESNARVYYHTKKGLVKWENTGTNLQNVTKDLRVAFVPDSNDYLFFQCDLSGADGWTVAADLAALGHRTMLDDYLVGIKPAKVLLLMLDAYSRGGERAAVEINSLPRDQLKLLTKAINVEEDDNSGRPPGWKYLCMKRVQHGTNYGAQPEIIAATIFTDSEGAIDLSKRDAGIYQYLYKLRYNPDARSDWVLKELQSKGSLTAACGIRRKFFDIRNPRNIESSTLKAALSFEPQANTTWVTNAALRKLYLDPENRNSQGHLFVEPLLQIHDALAGQFKLRHREWARGKLRQWFDNPLTIHGIEIRIPYEGNTGPNWKDLHDSL